MNIKDYTIEIKCKSEFVKLLRLNMASSTVDAGIKDGCKHYFWGWFDYERLLGQIEDGTQIDIKLTGLSNQNHPYEVYTHHGSIRVYEGDSENNIYTIPFSDILWEGYQDFMIVLTDNGIETFDVALTIELSGTSNNTFYVNSPRYAPVYQAVDWFPEDCSCEDCSYDGCSCEDCSFENIPMLAGNANSQTYYICGLVDVEGICEEYNIDFNSLTKIDLKLTSDSSQQYQIAVKNGTMRFGTYEADNGVYTVPIMDIRSAGYKEFAITKTSGEAIRFNTNVELEIGIDYGSKLDINSVIYAADDVQVNDDPRILDIHLPDTEVPLGGYPAVITIHGGAWSEDLTPYFGNSGRDYTDKDYYTAKYSNMHEFILGKGLAHININYRLMGTNGEWNYSNEAPYDGMLDDIKSAIDYVKDHYLKWINTNKLVLMGYSAGGHLAMLYAYSRGDKRIKLVVSEAGPTDIKSFSNNFHPGSNKYSLLKYLIKSDVNSDDLDEELCKSASPTNYVTPKSPMTILAYGYNYRNEGDGEIPYEQATALKKKFKDKNAEKKCRLFRFDNKIHEEMQALNIVDNYEVEVPEHCNYQSALDYELGTLLK